MHAEYQMLQHHHHAQTPAYDWVAADFDDVCQLDTLWITKADGAGYQTTALLVTPHEIITEHSVLTRHSTITAIYRWTAV